MSGVFLVSDTCVDLQRGLGSVGSASAGGGINCLCKMVVQPPSTLGDRERVSVVRADIFYLAV